MNKHRRALVGGLSGAALIRTLAAAGIIAPAMAYAEWNKAAFEAKTMGDTLRALGAESPRQSTDIQINAPDIAENGASVSVGVSSTLGKVTMMALLVEKNRNALVASFTLAEGTQADLKTRIKMAETSALYALIKADGKYFIASKEITVTVGGCG